MPHTQDAVLLLSVYSIQDHFIRLQTPCLHAWLKTDASQAQYTMATARRHAQRMREKAGEGGRMREMGSTGKHVANVSLSTIRLPPSPRRHQTCMPTQVPFLRR